MTGYGRGDCSQDGFKITVELSSVNRKQSEISINLPREMEMLEAQIRDTINRHVARGRLTVRVSLHAGTGNLSARMHLNAPLAKAYARELGKLAKELKLPGGVTLDQIVRAPGVFQTDEEIAETEDFWPAVEKALNKALATLVKMREREGAHLAKDLADRIAIMRRAVKTVQTNAPQVADRYREQLLARIKSAGPRHAGGGRRPAAQGGGLFRRPLGHHRGTDPPAKPLSTVRRQFEIQGAGGPHAGLSRAGDEPRDQHHRLQGQ